ncbi:epoxide hydrolase 4-like isoform X1, partial [Aphis craccivora]
MAVLVGGRDNVVVSISAAESLKMFSLSVVWGSWIVVKNAVALAVRPLWSDDTGHGNHKSAVATAAGKPIGRRALARDRPPPCLFDAVYGTHSYVKVK